MEDFKKEGTMIQDASDEAMREAHKGVRHDDAEIFVESVQTRIYNGVEEEVPVRKQPMEAGFVSCYYEAPAPGTSIVEGDLIYERDLEFDLGNGRTMLYDVYRPQGQNNVPVILSLTPYGKRHWYGRGKAIGLHQNMGVPKGCNSMYSVFEGVDPTYWCNNGYAVVNAEVCGCGFSKGDFYMFCQQMGQEGKAFVEHLAVQKWCNGKVGMAGNSALAMTQWWVAAERPEHLAAIAPWEGTVDMYRDSIYRGGVPTPLFTYMIFGDVRGPGWFEDWMKLAPAHPLYDDFWKEHTAKLENIKCPIYIGVGYSHQTHLRGSALAWRKVRSRRKWMRIHREFEWPDFYHPDNVEDLKRFFDRYLKGISNGWELTPPVRVQITDAYGYDYCTNRPEEDFPIPRTQYKKLYLNAEDASLNAEPVAVESKVSYDALTGDTSFDITFNEETEITGYCKLHLWVEAEGADDMDMFTLIQKLDKDGNFIPTDVFGQPHPGTFGCIKVSHRALDEKESTDYQPIQSHEKEEKLSAGEIVPIDIEFWPMGRIYHKGEQLRINIAGRNMRDPSWFGMAAEKVIPMINQGNHVIHTGGKYDSYVQLAVVPPKYQSGDYTYRG